MAGKVESKEKTLKSNSEVLLKFLGQDEIKLVNALIESEGKVLQAEITRLPRMSKLKSHRVIQRLIDRQVIERAGLEKQTLSGSSRKTVKGFFEAAVKL